MADWRFLLVLVAGITRHPTDGFEVVCSSYLIQVQVDSQVVLECQVIPTTDVKAMEIRWTKDRKLVHLYRFKQDENTQQDPAFQGRTHLFSQSFATGNVSLLLQRVVLADRGVFNCFVEFDSDANRDSNVKLDVRSLGAIPSINLLDYTEGGVRLVCESRRWYPLPKAVWRHRQGGELTRQPVTTSEQDAGSFYSVRSVVEVTSSIGSDYQCLITGLDASHSVYTDFHVPDEFFPRTSRWMGVFVVVLLAVMAAVVGMVILYRRLDRHIRDLEKRPTSSDYAQLLFKEDKLKSELDKLHDDLGKIRILPKAGMDRIRKAAVAVTLDRGRADPNLQVSSDLATVTCVMGRDIPSGGGGGFVMGKMASGDQEEGFTSGRHYWVVNVGGNSQWDLGVASTNDEKLKKRSLRPKGGFWTIGCYQKVFTANDNRATRISIHPSAQEKIQMIGVYVDYDEGKVLFCDDSTHSHLHSFLGCKFEGGLLPFFNVSGPGNSLTICPVVQVA